MNVVIKWENNQIRYIKSKGEEFDLPNPEKNKQYVAVGLITSPVKHFEKIDNGWSVETQNSTYHFLNLNETEIRQMVESNKLEEKITSAKISYWGNPEQLEALTNFLITIRDDSKVN